MADGTIRLASRYTVEEWVFYIQKRNEEGVPYSTDTLVHLILLYAIFNT